MHNVGVAKFRIFYLGAFLPIGILVFWEMVASWVSNPKLFPAVDYIFSRSLPSIAIFSGNPEASVTGAFMTIAFHSMDTLLRISVGLSLGVVSGVFVGLSIHFFRHTRRGNAFILLLIRAVPLFALIPLFLQWFGGRSAGIYLYITFSVFVVIATNTYEAVLNVFPGYIHQSMVLGANRYQIFRTVILYAIQPELMGGLKNVIGLSWAFSLGAEYLSARSGIGYLLYQSYLYSDMGKLIVFAGLYAIYGIISFTIAKNFIAYVTRWRHI